MSWVEHIEDRVNDFLNVLERIAEALEAIERILREEKRT